MPARDRDETRAEERRLRTVARAAAQEALRPDAFVEDLLERVTFNLLVGNGDAHAKNYSLAVSRTVTYAMAPLTTSSRSPT